MSPSGGTAADVRAAFGNELGIGHGPDYEDHDCPFTTRALDNSPHKLLPVPTPVQTMPDPHPHNPTPSPYLGRSKGVINWEVNIQKVEAAAVGGACATRGPAPVPLCDLHPSSTTSPPHPQSLIEYAHEARSCPPDGPMMVETHSYKLSPLGPAEQLHGGSRLISASSFWILLALALNLCTLPILATGSSQTSGSLGEAIRGGSAMTATLMWPSTDKITLRQNIEMGGIGTWWA